MRTKRNDAGNLSIDFLVGFTIFMVTFIYVATLIPSLFLNLQGYSIDYNAVAYRTGVILVEDPGMPYNPPWESLPVSYEGNILRFGLALSDGTTTIPNVLSTVKINQFFCSTWVYPDDYESRALFGSYPYHFNISLQTAGSNVTRSVGEVLPENYGYSRRVVKVKEESYATIGPDTGSWHPDYRTDDYNVTTHLFTIFLNYTALSENGPYYNNPAYQINPISPMGEGIMVNLTDLENTTDTVYDAAHGIPPPLINLTDIQVERSVMVYNGYGYSPSNKGFTPVQGSYELYIDGNSTAYSFTPTTPPLNITSNVSLVINPFTLNSWGSQGINPSGKITALNITLQFELSHGDGFLNSTQSQPYGAFDYNYDPANVTQPALQDGVMEVAVW